MDASYLINLATMTSALAVFAIGERAVKTPKDWADEEKIETREHSVGF